MKLLRTIRLDRSDTFVFAAAAAPGEWAVPGGFMFWDGDPAALDGKLRAAFRAGFLGLASFGWSTLVEVADASPEDVARATEALARRLLDEHGAPDLDTASAAAREEIAEAAGLADHPPGTIIALQRVVEADGSVRERFRTLKTTLEPGANTFAQGCIQPIGVARDDGGASAADADADRDSVRIEEVDLIGLMQERP